MQPENPSPQNPQYDFIFKDQQQAKPNKLGSIKKLPKPALILGILGAVFLLIILLAAFKGGSSAPQPFLSASARAQEISRVSALVKTQSKDPDTQALASTTEAVLSSSQSEINAYMKKSGMKVDAKALLSFQDKKTDALLSQALQENKLEEKYNSYLKSSLGAYRAELQKASLGIGKNGKALVEESLSSAQIILSAPQLAKLPGS